MDEPWVQFLLVLGFVLTIYNTIAIIFLRIAISRGSRYPSAVRARLMAQSRRRRENNR